MAHAASSGGMVLPVDDTLRRIAAAYRSLAWLWMLILVLVEVTGASDASRPVLAAAMSLATAWLGVTVWAATRSDRLGSAWFAVSDGLVAIVLSAAGWLAGADDFVSGGWPGSWLFMVAFASNLRWTLAAGGVLVASHAWLHVLLDLEPLRTAGTFQFITLALVVGWAFDALRHRDELRLGAERALAREMEQSARHQERTRLALHLHDSVLQTLHAIRVEAERPDEVRYLTRLQERELRRTIEEFRSPYEDSFRARLQRHRDEVEDLCRGLTIAEVIRDDAPVSEALEAGLQAAREAMMNAGKHAGVDQIDLYSEISDGEAVICVRDRGVGFEAAAVRGRGSAMVGDTLAQWGGRMEIVSAPGAGTDVTIRVPLP